MDLCHVPTLRALLERHGLSPTKKFGQHFLVSPRVVNAILSRVPVEIAGVMEVGPGPGVLTQGLIQSARKVIAVEIDPVAVSALTESAPDAEVVQGDALETDLGALIGHLPPPRALVSNMPYNITGPLLTRFTGLRAQYEVAVLMMQREVGMKLMAKPGDRDMGSISVMIQSRFEVDFVVDAPGGAFFPPPKVDSVVLALVPRQLNWSAEFDQAHESLVRHAFRQPRKTLANNLRDLNLGAIWSHFLASEHLSTTVRPHELNLEQWQRLAEAVHGPG